MRANLFFFLFAGTIALGAAELRSLRDGGVI